MLEKSKITEFPVELRKYCVSDLSVRNEDQAIILYTPNAKLSETAQPGFISKNQLDNLTKRLSKRYDTKCDVIYLKSDKREISNAVRDKSTIPSFIQKFVNKPTLLVEVLTNHPQIIHKVRI